MKRSEMLMELQQIIDDHLDPEVILKALESKGMKPPFSNKVFQKECRTLQEPQGYGWDDE